MPIITGIIIIVLFKAQWITLSRRTQRLWRHQLQKEWINGCAETPRFYNFLISMPNESTSRESSSWARATFPREKNASNSWDTLYKRGDSQNAIFDKRMNHKSTQIISSGNPWRSCPEAKWNEFMRITVFVTNLRFGTEHGSEITAGGENKTVHAPLTFGSRLIRLHLSMYNWVWRLEEIKS